MWDNSRTEGEVFRLKFAMALASSVIIVIRIASQIPDFCYLEFPVAVIISPGMGFLSSNPGTDQPFCRLLTNRSALELESACKRAAESLPNIESFHELLENTAKNFSTIA